MRRIRCIVEYEGTDYVGWQVQPNGVSVQQKINEALYRVTGERIQAHGSGRTDSGVHARAQTAHFDTLCRMPADKYCFALNCGLPRDIRVIYSDETAPDFHARFSVKKKHYRYTLLLSPHDSPFTRHTALHMYHAPDLSKMREAAATVVGEHDFAAFKAAGVELKSTVREIFTSDWSAETTPFGKLLHYDICGSGFMYNMVRILAGTMVEIGQGRRPVSSMAKALASCDRSDAGATAPAHGLMLWRVEYPDFDTEDIICNG